MPSTAPVLLLPAKPQTIAVLLSLSPAPHPLPLALSLSLPVTAAAIHTGPPRNVPILVAGQHYRTTEASNGSFAEQPVIGRLFSEEGLLQCCMTT